MTVIANIQVGNEVELIDQHIAYHLALGVDGFVIADMASVDGTSEKLDRYQDDKRFVIRKYEMGELIDASGPRTADVGRWMLEATRKHFAPDWVVRLDADEFLYPRNTLEAALAACSAHPSFRIRRRNVIFAAGQPLPHLPITTAELARFLIVAQPAAVSGLGYQQDDSLPLILTEVVPKVLARSGQVSAYATGGHDTFDAQGVLHDGPVAEDLLIAHFWFTSPGRFVRKARFTALAEDMLRSHPTATKGWQWARWASIAQGQADEGDAAILQEYHRQFPSVARLDELQGAGTLCRVHDYWAA